jgi:hypothetical protein
VVWLDSGKPLTADQPRPWKEDLHDYQHTPHEARLPWIKAPTSVSSTADDGLELSAVQVPLDYGQTLDKEAMAQDPFYSLHELLMSCARSESQFLAIIDSKIRDIEVVDNFLLAELTYLAKLLEKHAKALRQNVAFLELPHPSNPKLTLHTGSQAQDQLQTFKCLLKRTERNLNHCECLLSIFTQRAAINEPKKAVTYAIQATYITKMTIFLFLLSTFIYASYGIDLKSSTRARMDVLADLGCLLALVQFFAWVICKWAWPVHDIIEMPPKVRSPKLWLSTVLERSTATRALTKIRPPQKQTVCSPESEEPGEDNSHLPTDRTVLPPDTARSLAAYRVPQHETSLSILSEDASSISTCTSNETSDGTESFSDDSDVDSIGDLATQKAQIVDHLMVYVYDMFTLPDVKTCKGGSGSGSSKSVDQGNEKTTKGLPPSGPKRTLYSQGEGDPGEDQNEQDDDDAGKPRKANRQSPEHDSVNDKRLACPYYKRDPHAHKSSKACGGPGWYKMHRLK